VAERGGHAHNAGFRTTSTIMYGHIDGRNWARHLIRLRDLQKRTRGIPSSYRCRSAHGAPMYLKRRAAGPTFREAVLMHAVARLALHPHITNIQVSWVKMGAEGARAALNAGANDMGGTLMNESISRAAGAAFGQEFPPERMEELIRSIGRKPVQRTTVYGLAPKTARSPPSTPRARADRPDAREEVRATPRRSRVVSPVCVSRPRRERRARG
jgi:FO synthase